MRLCQVHPHTPTYTHTQHTRTTIRFEHDVIIWQAEAVLEDELVKARGGSNASVGGQVDFCSKGKLANELLRLPALTTCLMS